MKNLNRLCAFLFLAGILFSAFSPFVFAQQPDREITYPVLENCPPGTPPAQCAETPNTTRELPKIIRYLFNFGLVVSGFVAFGALVYGGVRYLFSAGNPGALGEARDQVLAAILGIAVLFSSYMLLTTINPQLVVLSLPASGATKGGIVLYSQQGCIDQGEEGKDFIHAKSMLSDLPDSFNRTFDNQGNINGDKPVQSVRFLSPPEEVNVTLYPKDNYSSGNQSDLVWKSEQHLDEILNSSTRCVAVGKVVDSVNLEWRSPGIYLFAENDCKGDARLYVGNTSNFGDFDNKARSLMIIPTLEKVLLPGPVLPGEAQAYASQVKAKLGAILYENENFKDDAAVFLGGEVPKLDDPDYNKKLKPDCIDFDKLKSCSTTQ
ncbi:MAG: hypothetical protein Q7S63_02415, partial [bacterium]|nr:hypothetical protein [bacterium]